MGKALGAAIGIVEIAAGLVLSDTPIGEPLIAAGASSLLGYAVSLLLNPHRSPLTPIGANYAGTLESRRIIFGELTVGGMYTTPPMTAGLNNDYLDLVFVGAGHPITSYGDVYFNNLRIANADIGAVIGSMTDGAVTNLHTNNGYQGLAWIRRYAGAQTTPDSILYNTYTAWDLNHVGKSLAYWAVRLQYNQTAFATGVPNITVHLKGAAVYDPRLDSTNGGSGSQRFATPSTWAYSTNPALCLAYYLTQPLGLGEPFGRVDWTLCQAAATICDEQVSVPIPVVPGLLTWNASSTAVGGIGTNFLRDLNGGQFTQSGSNWIPTVATYILGPDSAMHQVASVQTDTLLTLSSAYTGTTTTDFVAQWNNSTATTILQSRFTCNVTLDATARFEDNVAQLARAMMGQCVYSGGMWRMYAGAWSGSAFTLAETDLAGAVSIQCSTPRQNLYNAVRGNFMAAAKNYQPDEFPAILNASYVTEDGETIYTETNFPCCTDMFEAQRNAMIVSRVSRDQKIVTAEFGMSAYGVKVWETGTVTIAEIGWNQQTVRCIGWKFTPRGSIQLTLQEAYSADWTDPAPSNYAIAGTNATAAAGLYLPYPVTALTTSSQPGGIQFNFALPLQVAPGTQIQLLEYTANTPASSASLIWQGAATNVTLAKGDTTVRYYWARTIGPNGQLSSYYPTGNGVAGVALTPTPSQQWVPINNGAISGRSAEKASGADDWDTVIYSLQEYATCHIQGKPNTPSGAAFMIGLISAANLATIQGYAVGGNSIYAAIDYGIYANGIGAGVYQYFKAGTNIGNLATINAGDAVGLTYDATNVKLWLNQAQLGSNIAATGPFYGIVAFYRAGDAAGINSLEFGPAADFANIDGSQITSGAIISRHFGFHSIDPRGSSVLARGSIPPSVTPGGFSYSGTGGSLTITWSAFTLYYADGTTASISGGSQGITGLTTGTQYTVYPYVVDGATTVSFVTGASGAAGSPAICYAGGSAAAAAIMAGQANDPLQGFQVVSPSSGGGGGGNAYGCLHPKQLIELAGGAVRRAEELVEGDLLPAPGGSTPIGRIRRRRRGLWVRVRLAGTARGMTLTVTPDHRFLAPDGDQVRAEDLGLGTIIGGDRLHFEIRGLELLEEPADMVSLELPAPHVYYLNGALSHNLKP